MELVDCATADAFRAGANAERSELGARPGREYVELRARLYRGNIDHFVWLAEQARGRLHAAQEWLKADDARTKIGTAWAAEAQAQGGQP